MSFKKTKAAASTVGAGAVNVGGPPPAARTSAQPRQAPHRAGPAKPVEQRIQEAMANGAFDDLPGKGAPLSLDSNPYLEPGQELAFGLLQNNGFAPEWIERDKEIRRDLEAARAALKAARQRCGGDGSAWQAAVARFESQLNKLNRKIDDFNLITPVVSCQRARLQLAAELRRAQEDA